MGVAVSLREGGTSGQLEIDDGTAVICLTVPSFMMQRISKSAKSILGMTLDCIANVTAARELLVDQVAVVEDVHAETLRWFELSFQQGQKGNKGSPYSLERGYPSREVTPEDLFKIIQFDCSVEEDDERKGMGLEDLAAIFQLDVATIDTLIQKLQMTGQVYRNNKGLFLPL